MAATSPHGHPPCFLGSLSDALLDILRSLWPSVTIASYGNDSSSMELSHSWSCLIKELSTRKWTPGKSRKWMLKVLLDERWSWTRTYSWARPDWDNLGIRGDFISALGWFESSSANIVWTHIVTRPKDSNQALTHKWPSSMGPGRLWFIPCTTLYIIIGYKLTCLIDYACFLHHKLPWFHIFGIFLFPSLHECARFLNICLAYGSLSIL